jgi:hypothetical protein
MQAWASRAVYEPERPMPGELVGVSGLLGAGKIGADPHM